MHSQKEKDVVYSHVTLASDDGKLTGEIQEIKKKMTFLENSVKQNDSKHLDLGKSVDKRLEAFESQLQTIKKAIKAKNSWISSLEKKLKEHQSSALLKNEKNKERIKELEGKLSKPDKQIKILNDKISAFESKEKSEESLLFKCEECDFTTLSTQGMKTHEKRKHTKIPQIL